MAAVVGDIASSYTYFHRHAMISGSESRTNSAHVHNQQSDYQPFKSRKHSADSSPQQAARSEGRRGSRPGVEDYSFEVGARRTSVTRGDSSRRLSVTKATSDLPSPPSSSSPAAINESEPAADNALARSMASQVGDHVSPAASQAAAEQTSSVSPTQQQQQQQQQRQQPSPPSDRLTPQTRHASSITPASQIGSSAEQAVVHLRDLAHVHTLMRPRADGTLSSDDVGGQKNVRYEISGMPIGDVIEMVAALLTRITTTNDEQHDALQRNAAHQQQANQGNSDSTTSSTSHSVLAFHGRNVPAITILSYLSRIHRYCPTTYEVFLSLLVYFDRMTERVNLDPRAEDTRGETASAAAAVPAQPARSSSRPENEDSHVYVDNSDSDLADDDEDDGDDEAQTMVDSPTVTARDRDRESAPSRAEQPASVTSPVTYFVVDSFNIHRLIIAGVTCASKFFSDVFYTNSRYARVSVANYCTRIALEETNCCK